MSYEDSIPQQLVFLELIPNTTLSTQPSYEIRQLCLIEVVECFTPTRLCALDYKMAIHINNIYTVVEY